MLRATEVVPALDADIAVDAGACQDAAAACEVGDASAGAVDQEAPHVRVGE